MAHPYSTFPDICKEDTGNFSTPTTAIQEDGWPDSSVPAAQHFNWFAHWTSKWVNYLASIVPDDLLAQLTGININITTNLTNIAANASAIAANVTDIATNASNISSNDTDIATNAADIATNAANISSNDTDIATNVSNISTNATNIATNTSDIADNASDISAMHNAGVQPIFYNPTDVYLSSDNGSITPTQVLLNVTVFNGLIHIKWPSSLVIMTSANTTDTLRLEKTTTDWPTYMIFDGLPNMLPVVVVCDGNPCAGAITLPTNATYTNSFSRFVIYIAKDTTFASENYSQFHGTYFRNTSGLRAGGITYKTTIVTP